MADYAVNFWASHPDADNDDCISGKDFDTLAEALACFHARPTFSDGRPVTGTAYVEIDGPGVYRVRKNPDCRPTRQTDREWQDEIAWQAGMAFGCQGYNDARGY